MGYAREWTVVELSKETKLSRPTLYSILSHLVALGRVTHRGSNYLQKLLWNMPEAMITALSRAIGDQPAPLGEVVVRSPDRKWERTVMDDGRIFTVLTLKEALGIQDASAQG